MSMITNGLLVLGCGIAGFTATIIWILVDITTKDQRQKMMVRRALENSLSHNSLSFVRKEQMGNPDYHRNIVNSNRDECNTTEKITITEHLTEGIDSSATVSVERSNRQTVGLFSEVPSDNNIQVLQSQNKARLCRECGNSILSQGKFCSRCGYRNE